MKTTVLPLDNFMVINKSLLNEQDRVALTLLYQPIIGSISVSLYLTLWGFVDKAKITTLENNHYDLISSMQMKLEDLISAREKLEAIGLLKTYYKKDSVNHFIYELYSPLPAYEFLNNPILNTALYSNVSKKEYKRIMAQFSFPEINLKEYEDISCNFKDVYHFAGGEYMENPNIEKAHYLGLNFEPTIEFNEVLSNIPEELLNYKTIGKNIKNLIYQLALIYNLKNDQMIEIIKNSCENKRIDIELLKENCKNYYKFESKGKIPKIIFENQPIELRQNQVLNTRKSRLIHQFETTNPYEFLEGKQDGTPTQKDLELLEYLIIEQNMNPGVVNVLIDYVLKINNNKLVRTFVEQIASQWKRSKIETVEDAMEFSLEEYDKRNNVTKKNNKKIEKAPSWLDQDIDSEILTDDELAQFEEQLKGVKND